MRFLPLRLVVWPCVVVLAIISFAGQGLHFLPGFGHCLLPPGHDHSTCKSHCCHHDEDDPADEPPAKTCFLCRHEVALLSSSERLLISFLSCDGQAICSTLIFPDCFDRGVLALDQQRLHAWNVAFEITPRGPPCAV